MINIDDFKKLEIKIGTIISAEAVEGADKLIKFMVDLGEESPRQILSGVKEYYPDYEVLVGKQVPVLTNLEPRTIRGLTSAGMILYVTGEGDNFTVLEPGKKVFSGTKVS